MKPRFGSTSLRRTRRQVAFTSPAPTGNCEHNTGPRHGAYILAQVESSVGGTERNITNIITIADCKRVIELEFYLGTASDRRESLVAMDLLMKVLGEFRRALWAEAVWLQKADKQLQRG